MKKLLLCAALCSVPALMSAQSAMDGFNLSQTDMKGTARFMSMGGAFTALGGDLSAITYNPGGIGVYRSTDIGMTVDWDFFGSKADGSGMKCSTNSNKFLINNIGYVGTARLGSSLLANFNWGFGYNRAASFNRRYSGRGMQNHTSMSNWIAGFANDDLMTPGDLTTTTGYDPYNPTDGGYVAPWIAILGYDSYMINPVENENGSYTWHGLWDDKTTGTSYMDVSEEGGVDEYNITFGGNFANVVYWGMDFGITDLQYKRTSLYGETLNDAVQDDGEGLVGGNNAEWDMYNTYRVSGTGFTYKLGLIVKPIQQLRLGVAFHTPTWYSFDQYFYADTQYSYPQAGLAGGAMTNDGWEGSSSFNFRTPWRLMFGAAAVISNNLIVSADYEMAERQNMKFTSKSNYWYGYPYLQSDDEFYYTNMDVKNYYKTQSTLRLGAEYRITPQFSARLGYVHSSSPVKADVKEGRETVYTSGTRLDYSFDNATNYVTFGLGFRISKFYLDAAFVSKMQSSQWHAFPSVYEPVSNGYAEVAAPAAKISSHNNQLVVTAGFRF